MPEWRERLIIVGCLRDSTARIATPSIRPGELSQLRQDLALDPVIHRRESLLFHPQFLLKDVGGLDLQSRVEDCHLRTALVIQSILGLAREGSEPSRVMKSLCALLEGAGSEERTPSHDSRRDPSLPAKAHAILSLAQDEVEALSNMGYLNRFLWIPEKASQPSEKAGSSWLVSRQGGDVQVRREVATL
jgi:hypothetical protein